MLNSTMQRHPKTNTIFPRRTRPLPDPLTRNFELTASRNGLSYNRLSGPPMSKSPMIPGPLPSLTAAALRFLLSLHFELCLQQMVTVNLYLDERNESLLHSYALCF